MSFLRGYAALLSIRYWFNLQPVPFGSSLVSGILAFFAWFVVASVALLVIARSTRKQRRRLSDLLRRLAHPLMNAGLLGLLFLFFTYEQVPVLDMRAWFLATLILFLVQIGGVVRYAVIDYPRLQHEESEKARREKYFSKKK